MTSVKSVDNAETAVLAAAKDMLRRGLVEGTAGNISARRSDGNIVVTPSSVDYQDMELEDLVLVDPEGGVLQAKEGRSPSRISRFRPASTSSRSTAVATFAAPSTPRLAHPMSGPMRSRPWKAAAPP